MRDGGLNAKRQSSSGRSVWRRKATIIASSSAEIVVERISLGPIGASAVVARLRHFYTVVGLTPKRLASALTLS